MRLSPRDHLEEAENLLLRAGAVLSASSPGQPMAADLARVAQAHIALAHAFATLPAMEQTGLLMEKTRAALDRELNEP